MRFTQLARRQPVTQWSPPCAQPHEKFLNAIIQDSLGALLICLASISNTLIAILTVINYYFNYH